MGKRVVIIASGETERRSLPHLVRHLEGEGVIVTDIRIPGGHRALNVEMARKLIKAAWFSTADGEKPDKVVILVDADGKDPADVLRPLQADLPGTLGARITLNIQFACAQWHLEAWFMADAEGLKNYLKRNVGSVVSTSPDDIHNPKQHLKNLLGDKAYTSNVSEEIARTLDPQAISRASRSFNAFLRAVRNGSSSERRS